MRLPLVVFAYFAHRVCIGYDTYTLEISLDVLYAPTTNGGNGPQQTNGSSLIILYLICSYDKRSLLNNSHYCDFM